MIKFIFIPSQMPPGLAHGACHCVTGLTLPPVDANLFFIIFFSLSEVLEKKL